jgi:spore maturation protein CgeB
VRILLLDHYYENFVRRHYEERPGLASETFDVQAASLEAAMFGETGFQIAALRALGHEALFFPINVAPMAEAWAAEHGVDLPRRWHPAFRRGRCSLPRPSRRERWQWMAAILNAIAVDFGADVIHAQCTEMLSDHVVRSLGAAGRLMSAQTASPVVPWDQLRSYDLLVSSLPHYVARAQQSGLAARYLPLGFEPRLASELASESRSTSVSFVGSLSPHHRRRIDLLSALASRVPLEIWSPEQPSTWAQDRRAVWHGAAWGREMYHVLGASRITINVHGEHAAGYANNLRLFEATGMGALLVTEAAPNLADLFEPGVEVVTYRDAAELADTLAYYVAHPVEASEIAARGQARTLRDHVWERRMGELVELFAEARAARGFGAPD